MSRVPALLEYKLKMFFGPSYRGRFGPLPLIGLMLAFVPTGLGVGYGIGVFAGTLDPAMIVVTLGAVIGAGLAFGFIFALGVGVTAHPSELDFLMTAQVKPREYLLADMLFEFSAVLLTGGVSMLFAIGGFLLGAGRPIWIAFPLLLVAGLFMVLVFMIVQSVTVLKITRPNAPVRSVAVLLVFLSVLPALAFFGPSLSSTFSELPIPQSAFGTVLYDIAFAKPLAPLDALVAAAYLAAVGAIWYRLSTHYFFYGVRPTLSAGLGQIDMNVKMAQQRRLISLFGRSSGRISLQVDKGGDLSLMTRLNLVRVWRDGSVLFIGLLVALFLFSALSQSGSTGFSVQLSLGGSWPIAILALNWLYYERANLWLPVVSGKALTTYFKGLLVSLLIIGAVIAAFMGLVLTAAGEPPTMNSIALLAGALAGNSVVATMMLMRFKVQPGAFSPGMILVLFGTFIAGAVFGFVAALLTGLVGGTGAMTIAMQSVIIVVFDAAILYLGFASVGRLSKGFEFS